MAAKLSDSTHWVIKTPADLATINPNVDGGPAIAVDTTSGITYLWDGISGLWQIKLGTAPTGSVAITGEAGAVVTATTGPAAVVATAGTAFLTGSTQAKVHATAGDVTLQATGNVNMTWGPANELSMNGASFLGSFTVGALPVGATLAFAFATNVRNLDGGGIFPALQLAATPGIGGLVHRGTNGAWYLMGTNIFATA